MPKEALVGQNVAALKAFFWELLNSTCRWSFLLKLDNETHSTNYCSAELLVVRNFFRCNTATGVLPRSALSMGKSNQISYLASFIQMWNMKWCEVPMGADVAHAILIVLLTIEVFLPRLGVIQWNIGTQMNVALFHVYLCRLWLVSSICHPYFNALDSIIAGYADSIFEASSDCKGPKGIYIQNVF